MAKKNNIRSIRMSDRIVEIIEAQAGDNFTDKFERLVTRCMWELPDKEQQLESIEARIKEKREDLRKLSNKAYKYNSQLFEMSNKMELIGKAIEALSRESRA